MIKRSIAITILSISALFFTAQQSQAQFALGAAYEIRDEVPENGFGLRLEKGIFSELPLIDLGVRAHFSFFNETSDITLDDISVSTEVDAYDYGLALLGGVNIGIVKPYVGVGVGSERIDADPQFTENNFYWNGIGGAEVTLLPFLNPFIEYRIKNISGSEDIGYDSVNRLAIGVNIRF
jgi:opacity protein-like surface antigen